LSVSSHDPKNHANAEAFRCRLLFLFSAWRIPVFFFILILRYPPDPVFFLISLPPSGSEERCLVFTIPSTEEPFSDTTLLSLDSESVPLPRSGCSARTPSRGLGETLPIVPLFPALKLMSLGSPSPQCRDFISFSRPEWPPIFFDFLEFFSRPKQFVSISDVCPLPFVVIGRLPTRCCFFLPSALAPPAGRPISTFRKFRSAAALRKAILPSSLCPIHTKDFFFPSSMLAASVAPPIPRRTLLPLNSCPTPKLDQTFSRYPFVLIFLKSCGVSSKWFMPMIGFHEVSFLLWILPLRGSPMVLRIFSGIDAVKASSHWPFCDGNVFYR